MPNLHWNGTVLNDRGWYVVAWLMGLGIAIGLLLVVDFRKFQRWLHHTEAPFWGRWLLRPQRRYP